jgi:hypothetical protein
MSDFSNSPNFDDIPEIPQFADAERPFDMPYENTDFSDGEQPYEVLPPLEVDIADEGIREIGNPEALKDYWQYQKGPYDCALYAQGGILEAMGQDFDLDTYRQQGIDGGWYSPDSGTYPDDIGKLLEENGVPTTRYEDATIQDMANELNDGHGVAVAVDCLPIWGEPGGHALWVTGLEVGQDGVPTDVICNDSGQPEGAGIAYPFDSFMQAWAGYDNLMVATQQPLSVFA